MSNEEVKNMLESLRDVLKSGPSDKFRSDLKTAVSEIIEGKKPLKDLVSALRPLLKSVATGFLDSGNVHGALAALRTMKNFK